MMKGYWLILGTAITDPEAQADYGRLWAPIAEKYGARLVRSPAVMDRIEARHETARMLLVEFPSVATARACYDDPDYQVARVLANKAAHRDLVILEADIPEVPA